MRSDARRNYDHVLAVARDVLTEEGADASLRNVARRADVGLGTLYRHFPTREALLEALLHTTFAELVVKADELEVATAPEEALVAWFRDCAAFTHQFRGVLTPMMAAIEDPESALHTSCVGLRAAGARLLTRAQEAGVARDDLDGTDLFALIAALAWLHDQASTAARADHLLDVVAGALLTTGRRCARGQ